MRSSHISIPAAKTTVRLPFNSIGITAPFPVLGVSADAECSPGKSSSSSNTAVLNDWASASSGLLHGILSYLSFVTSSNSWEPHFRTALHLNLLQSCLRAGRTAATHQWLLRTAGILHCMHLEVSVTTMTAAASDAATFRRSAGTRGLPDRKTKRLPKRFSSGMILRNVFSMRSLGLLLSTTTVRPPSVRYPWQICSTRPFDCLGSGRRLGRTAASSSAFNVKKKSGIQIAASAAARTHIP